MTPCAADAELLTAARAALDQWEQTAGEATSSVLGTGAVGALERTVAQAAGRLHALALPSATIALRVALQAVGVGPGDEVLVSAYDWTAAAAAVRSLGAVPIGVDIALRAGTTSSRFVAVDPTMDPGEAAKLTDTRTRAIVVTHLLGVNADLHSLGELARSQGIALIEDASQGPGIVLQPDRRDLPDISVLSLGPGKLLDAGEGGLVLTDRLDLHREAIAVSQHPLRQRRAGLTANRGALITRIHPLAAMLALASLNQLPDELSRLAIERRRVDELAEQLTAPTVAPAPSRHQPGLPALTPPGWTGEIDPGNGLRWVPTGHHALPEPLAALRRPIPRALAADERLVVLDRHAT